MYDSSVFNFLRNRHTVFHSSCLDSDQQYTFPISPHSFASHSNRCEVIYLTVVSVCIPLMVSDVKHLFMYLLVIRMSSLEKFLFRFFVVFTLDSLGSYLLLGVESSSSCLVQAASSLCRPLLLAVRELCRPIFCACASSVT